MVASNNSRTWKYLLFGLLRGKPADPPLRGKWYRSFTYPQEKGPGWTVSSRSCVFRVKETKNNTTAQGGARNVLDPGNGWREGSGLPKTVNHRQKRQVLPVIVTGQRQALHKNVTSVPAEAAARCRWLWDTPDFRCVNTKEHSRCGGGRRPRHPQPEDSHSGRP